MNHGIDSNNRRMELFLITCIIVSFKPIYVELLQVLNIMFESVRYICFLGLMIILLKDKLLKLRVDDYKHPLIFLLTWCLLTIITTLAYTPSEGLSLLSRILVMVMSYVSFAGLSKVVETRKILSFVRWLFISYLTFDAITTFSPIGKILLETSNSFLGGDNYNAFNIIIMLAFIFEISLYFNGEINKIDIIIYIVSLLTKIFTLSVAGIIGLAFFSIFTYYRKKIYTYRYVQKYMLHITNLLSVITIVIACNQTLSFYISKALLLFGIDKGDNLSFRSILWPKTLNAIMDKPLLGHGYYNKLNYQFQYSIGLNNHYEQANHAHNYLLELIYMTGIIGLLLFSIFVYRAYKSYFNNKNTGNILGGALSMFFLIGIFDGYIDLGLFFSLMAVMLNYNTIFKNMKCEDMPNERSK